ncbi:unnamed protein product [Schistosoma mattheei]|uniref:Uncharacterized protein n=1 Tax=Schistosoma mattheei TaxID=31246 RepID=A0A183PPB2_9TREM|nr:unnamed protein product [Schistosoma mattheei]
MFKRSNHQLWPILSRITGPLVSNVFIVGIYGGEVKPFDFNMSAALITELQELLTVCISADKCQVHLTAKLVAVICDTPARSYVRYVVLCTPEKWLLNNDHFLYRDDVTKNDVIDSVDFDSRFTLNSLFLDDYYLAEEMEVCLTAVLVTIRKLQQTMKRYRVTRTNRKGKLLSLLNHFCVRAVKRELNDYLCTCEELEVAEVEAVNDLSSKIYKLGAINERLSMGVMDRRTEQVDNSTIAFPLRTHGELRSFEVALDELRFRDQFVICNKCLNKF